MASIAAAPSSLLPRRARLQRVDRDGERQRMTLGDERREPAGQPSQTRDIRRCAHRPDCNSAIEAASRHRGYGIASRDTWTTRRHRFRASRRSPRHDRSSPSPGRRWHCPSPIDTIAPAANFPSCVTRNVRAAARRTPSTTSSHADNQTPVGADHNLRMRRLRAAQRRDSLTWRERAAITR